MGIHIALAPPSRSSALQSLRIFFSTSLPAPLTVLFHPITCAAPCPALACAAVLLLQQGAAHAVVHIGALLTMSIVTTAATAQPS